MKTKNKKKRNIKKSQKGDEKKRKYKKGKKQENIKFMEKRENGKRKKWGGEG